MGACRKRLAAAAAATGAWWGCLDMQGAVGGGVMVTMVLPDDGVHCPVVSPATTSSGHNHSTTHAHTQCHTHTHERGGWCVQRRNDDAVSMFPIFPYFFPILFNSARALMGFVGRETCCASAAAACRRRFVSSWAGAAAIYRIGYCSW